MPKIEIIPSPLLTSQARAAHPFYIGQERQTIRSKNLWVDERMRLLRRPATYRHGDMPTGEKITALFEYQHRSRASKPSRTLVGMTDGNKTALLGKFGECSIFSDVPPTGLKAGVPGRGKFSTLTDVYTANTVNFIWNEQVEIYVGGSGSSDGVRYLSGLVSPDGFVVNDEIGYAAVDGELIIRTQHDASNIAAAGSTFRVVGATSGTNVRFTVLLAAPGRRSIWLAKGSTVDLQTYKEGAITGFVQFGNLMMFTDDSFLYPVRVWSGGQTTAKFMTQAPRAGLIAAHQSRVWLADLEQNGSEIIGSRVNDPYSWAPDGSIDGPISLQIEQDDRDSITAIAPSFRGDLYIWKSKSIHRVTGLIGIPQPPQFQLTFQRQTVSRSIGCSSSGTVASVGNDLYWMSDKGVHSMEATQKFGDVETSYLSFEIADVFERLNLSRLNQAQAVFEPRLGLYLLGVAKGSSDDMNLLLAYAVASKRWMSWDIGAFSAMSLGPPIGGDSSSVYVGLVDAADTEVIGVGGVPTTSLTKGRLAVLDFTGQTDYSREMEDEGLTNISTVIEPGEIFTTGQPTLRYTKKSINRLQMYLVPSGDFQADIISSWDGGREKTVKLNLNPHGDPTFRTGYRLGADEPDNELHSENETSVSSVPIVGRGHNFKWRVEDSNPGRLPYLHADLEVEMHDKDYTAQARNER